MASVVLFSLGVPALFSIPLQVLVLLGLWISFRNWGYPTWKKISCDKGNWTLMNEEGMQPVSFCWFYRFGQFLVVGFKDEWNGKIAVPLLSDSANSEQLRQLRQVLLLVSPSNPD
tara:strand:- start:10529 stop:10873 length:345 start_codon:yes stop_codon:yes gene_type:complete